VEVYDHAGSGHPFTDPSLPDEYDERTAALHWQGAPAFLDGL
jgi:hypothetical protein